MTPTSEQIKLEKANRKLNEYLGTEGINYYEGIEALGFLFKYAVPKLKEELTEMALGVLGVDWLQAVFFDNADPADSLFELCYKAFGLEE